MSTFVSKVNPVTGEMEWELQDDDYDYHQEVARSAYADMLHDTERNQMYYEALRDAINIMHERGKKANVLDIGTGTGLLSMMAVRCGADSVTAIEVFEPMAKCATQCMKDNGMWDKIKLIRKRSTEVKIGPHPDLDMPQRANILVTEVFDTELIGEGGISTFSQAHQDLLEDDCIVVPSAANMYIQVVHSNHIARWNAFQPLRGAGVTIDPPPDVAACPGAVALHDLQLDQISQDKFQPITKPFRCFRFDYSGKSKIEFSGHSKVIEEVQSSGTCDAVFMWWDLEMDTRGKVLLSCAPRWAHPTPDNMQWRDHWMQAVFYPNNRKQVQKGDSLEVHSFHDEYSLWFDVTTPGNDSQITRETPICRCDAHVTCSRSRIGMLNDMSRNEKYIEALQQVITKDSVCLSISDGSQLPLIAAQLGAKKVYALEPHDISAKMVKAYVAHNNLSDQITVLNKKADAVNEQDLDGHKVDVLLAEPYFSASVVPWHDIHYWYARSQLTAHLVEKPSVLPCCASMRAIGVDFDHLWKIRAPVGDCEGFDLSTFDKTIQTSSDIADQLLEPQPLWEYPGKPMTEPFSLLQFDFTKNLDEIKNLNRHGYINLDIPGTCNGVAVWLDVHLGKRINISHGLLEKPTPGQNLVWDENAKQGVHILKKPVTIPADSANKPIRLYYSVNFKPKSGEFEFVFNVQQSSNSTS